MVTEGFLPNGHGHPGVLPNGRPNGHGHPENFPNGQWSQPLGIDHMERLDENCVQSAGKLIFSSGFRHMDTEHT